MKISPLAVLSCALFVLTFQLKIHFSDLNEFDCVKIISFRKIIYSSTGNIIVEFVIVTNAPFTNKMLLDRMENASSSLNGSMMTVNTTGIYTCEFSQGSITHKGFKTLDVALLPDYIVGVANPQFPDCRENGVIQVNSTCSIKKSNETYTVKWTSAISNLKDTEEVYTSSTTVNCAAVADDITVTCSFENIMGQMKSQDINISIIKGDDNVCPKEEDWPLTKSGKVAVLQCADTEPRCSSSHRRAGICSEAPGPVGDGASIRQTTAELRQKRVYDLQSRGPHFQSGDLVWVFNPKWIKGRRPKLDRKRVGPCPVVERLGEVVYRVCLPPRGKTVILHQDCLAPYHRQSLPPFLTRSPASVPRSPRPLPNFPVASLFSLSPPHSPSAAPWKRSRPPPLALTELDTAPLVAPSPVQPPVQSSARAEHPFRMRRLPDRYDDFVLPRGRGTAVSLPLKGL
ncbi:UNVERIFIED_CONTAM: hypothetical protein FKN15_038229 [Acipenser sinensis]